MQDADVYFVVNTDNRPRKVAAIFRTPHRHAQLWDPLTGERTSLVSGARQTLELEAYGSAVVVFSGQAGPLTARRVLEVRQVGPGWEVAADDSPAERVETPRTVQALGRVVYRTSLHWNAEGKAARVWLDLGPASPGGSDAPVNEAAFLAQITSPVREAAEVWVNGRRAGTAWCAPYRVEMTGFLRPGANQVEIRVFPTAMNRLAGQARTDYSALSALFGRRFDMQDEERIRALPAGLTGPVTIRVERERP